MFIYPWKGVEMPAGLREWTKHWGVGEIKNFLPQKNTSYQPQ